MPIPSIAQIQARNARAAESVRRTPAYTRTSPEPPVIERSLW